MLPIVGLWLGESRTATVQVSAIEDSVKTSCQMVFGKRQEDGRQECFGKDSFGDYSIMKAR
jgi:hypothetical protein